MQLNFTLDSESELRYNAMVNLNCTIIIQKVKSGVNRKGQEILTGLSLDRLKKYMEKCDEENHDSKPEKPEVRQAACF